MIKLDKFGWKCFMEGLLVIYVLLSVNISSIWSIKFIWGKKMLENVWFCLIDGLNV